MASKRFPHVQLRNGTYYYCRRVPRKVTALPEAWEREFASRPSVRDSLGTKIYSEALKAAAQRAEQFDASVERALGKPAQTLARASNVQLTLVALGKISSDICTKTVLRWRGDINRANLSEHGADYLEHRLDQFFFERDGADINTAILSGRSPLDYARELNAKMGFCVPENSDEFGELVAAVIDGCFQARRSVNDLFEGHSVPREPTSTLMRHLANTKQPERTKTFSEVSEIQFATKSLAAKTRAKMIRSQALFIKLVGDKDINEYTKTDIRFFLDHLAEQQVGKATNGTRPISQTTMQSYLSGISSPFNFASSRGWLTEGNPTVGIKMEDWRAKADTLLVPARKRFEEHHLNAIFQHPWFSGCQSTTISYQPGEVLLDDMRYWAPVVALYTGARAGELGGLMLDEIHLDDVAPHIWIRRNKYRDTKSKLDRHVPILDALIELGFQDYVTRVRQTGSDRLFPDWKLPMKDPSNDTHYNWGNAKWIRAFNRTVIPSTLPHLANVGTRSPVVFHSLRGSFKFMLLGHGHPHLANAIIGHQQDDIDKAYIGSVSPKETYAAFRHADFDNLTIPPRRST